MPRRCWRRPPCVNWRGSAATVRERLMCATGSSWAASAWGISHWQPNCCQWHTTLVFCLFSYNLRHMNLIQAWIVPPDANAGATAYIVTAIIALLVTGVSKGGFGGGVGILSVP